MAKFCIVAPPYILEALEARNLMGSHHLLLAHDIVKHEDRYHALFHPEGRKQAGKLAHAPSQRHIILDNSVIELGKPVDLPMMQAAYQIVLPTAVVLPDIMMDPDATIKSCLDAAESWDFPSLMVIPQGSVYKTGGEYTLPAFTRCAEAFTKHPKIKWWGVPRNLVAQLGTRKEAIRVCRTLNPRRMIHMFGFSDNMVDDILCAQMPEVFSIDSAVPLRLNYPISMSRLAPKRGDWWDKAEYSHIIGENLTTVRNWVTAYYERSSAA